MYLFSEENGYHGDKAIDSTKLGWLHAWHGARIDIYRDK